MFETSNRNSSGVDNFHTHDSFIGLVTRVRCKSWTSFLSVWLTGPTDGRGGTDARVLDKEATLLVLKVKELIFRVK